MASRVYVTAKTTGTNLTGPPVGDWVPGDSTRDNRGDRRFVLRLQTSATDGGVVTSATSSISISPTAGQAVLAANNNGVVWVTDRLAAGVTLNGTLAITLKVSVPAAASLATAKYHVYAYVSVGDSLDERAVLIDNVTDATAWTATQTWRTATFTLSGEAGLTGDRIVVEVGALCSPPTAPSGSSSYTLGWGTTNSSHVVQADATNGSTGAGAAWMEFSNTLSFMPAPSAPANDACADATVIASLPYASGDVDTTSSADTDRSVWWTWTPTENQRVFVTPFGGNQSVWLRGWQGGCGSLTLISSSTTGDTNTFRMAWVGTSQSPIWFDAIAGTQYWFQIAQYFKTSGSDAQFAARNGGGCVRLTITPFETPADGDLWISCQHLVGYRDGQVFNVASDFYALTPTNSSIDYTRLPMDDLNGGSDTSLRLYVALFSTSTPLVEILDLATLNNGEFEIDFIDAPLGYVGHSDHAASLIFTGHTEGEAADIMLGYFGDNYSVRGQLSSANACRVNRINSRHADNQTGAPWADAQAITVAQDVGGSDYIELSSDGSTLYYTSAGTKVLSYDLDGAVQLPTFATLPTQGSDVPRPGARGLRLLWPYDGTGGMIVAYGNCVQRLDRTGAVIHTYTPTQTDQAQDLDKIELTPDGSSFWVSDQYSCWMFKFAVDGGQLDAFATHLPPGQLCGFTILGYRGTPAPFDVGDPEDFPVRYLRRSPIISDQEARIYHSRAQVVMQGGIGTTTGQGQDPQCMMRFSDDGGHTYGSEAWRSIGEKGNYNARVLYYRLGQTRNRVYEVTVSDPAVPVTLIDLVLDLTKGSN